MRTQRPAKVCFLKAYITQYRHKLYNTDINNHFFGGKSMLKRYLLYLVRWQLSTPILAICLMYLQFGVTWNTIIANFIGGLIFFWVDKFIFTSKVLAPQWEIAENIKCHDCGETTARGYRLVRAKNYDRTSAKPEFRCEKCSISKSQKQKKILAPQG